MVEATDSTSGSPLPSSSNSSKSKGVGKSRRSPAGGRKRLQPGTAETTASMNTLPTVNTFSSAGGGTVGSGPSTPGGTRENAQALLRALSSPGLGVGVGADSPAAGMPFSPMRRY